MFIPLEAMVGRNGMEAAEEDVVELIKGGAFLRLLSCEDIVDKC